MSLIISDSITIVEQIILLITSALQEAFGVIKISDSITIYVEQMILLIPSALQEAFIVSLKLVIISLYGRLCR